MEGSNPTPYFFVNEIFLNIIIVLRRLFMRFLLHFECFTIVIFFVCSLFFVVVFCLFLFPAFSFFTYNSCHYHSILYIYNTKNSAQVINLPLMT